MRILKLIGAVWVAGLLATQVSAQTATVFLSAGSTCTGATSANFTVGGPAVPVSICTTINPTTVFACGHTLQLKSANAAEAGAFSVTSRTTGSLFTTGYAETINPFVAQPVVLAGTGDLGAVYTGGTAASGAANLLLATVDLTPQAGATNAAYVISFNSNSDLITNTNAACSAGLVDNTPLTATFTLNRLAAPTPTAPTASLGAAPTLTGGAGTQPVTVLTPGSLTGQLVLGCTVGASTPAAAAIAISSGITQTILAGATTATPIGLTCTPQAAAATATLTCIQTPTPAAVLPNLTSTITCPVVVAGVVAYTATPTPLSFTGVTAGTPTANQVVTVAATAGNAAAVNLSACAFGGANAADFSFNPAPTFPVAIAAGGNTTIPVRFTPALANSAARTATLTCQVPNATVAGATSFVITLNGTNPAATPIVVAATTPPGAVTLPGYQPGVAGPGTSSTTLAFSATGGAAALTCTAGGAGYTATPSPLNLAAGATGSVTVTYTGTVAGTFPGTLNCTSTAPATGGPFAYTLSTSVTAFVPPVATVTVPTMGAFGLGLMGLLVAGFGALVQRRRIG
jgi:hypothetical protein